jgi:leucyl aminopeptidase
MNVSRTPYRIALAGGLPAAVPCDAMVVGAFVDASPSGAAALVDSATGGRLAEAVKRGDLASGPGSCLLFLDPPGLMAPRLFLVSLGKRGDWSLKSWRAAITGAGKALASLPRVDTAAVCLEGIEAPGRGGAWQVRHAARLLADSTYRFDYPSAEPRHPKGPGRMILVTSSGDHQSLETPLKQGLAIAEGMALAKDLGNLPGNVCTPGYFQETAESLGRDLGLVVRTLGRPDLEALGMHSFLSVGRASQNPCRLVVMEYRNAREGGRPVVLVGKGITFDTGGISLKPGADMDEMKFDMSGAGSVFGTMLAAARMEAPVHLVGLVAAAENMPGSRATRPGDVVRSMSGQTIEILNTDAEGRLVLCDTLTYAERFEADCVVDIATLTGACIIALGHQTSGLYANDDALGDLLFRCGEESGDRAWRMPLWDEYQDQLKSNFADMANLGGRPAGSVTAACFLSRFAKGFKWAHLDIAGTAALSGPEKGSTGRPVPLLTEFLLHKAGLLP